MTMTPTTRSGLRRRLRDPGDHAAWVEFVSLYEPVIYRVLRRTGLQDADALEVLQDLFLVVSRNLERWLPRAEHGSFRGWLRRVTRNLVVSWVRRQIRQVTSSSVDLDALLEWPPAIDGPETDVLQEMHDLLVTSTRARNGRSKAFWRERLSEKWHSRWLLLRTTHG